jgi:hypothetical protein
MFKHHLYSPNVFLSVLWLVFQVTYYHQNYMFVICAIYVGIIMDAMLIMVGSPETDYHVVIIV